ncbi:MAG: XRE family transcriptional regulator [Oscillospiraceae bacterium]|nr:XRE family transcriptional regulator [Oscillospiraceae bacterium]
MKNTTLGQRLKFAREQKGLFQDKLAELIGVTSGKIISNWETGLAKPDADKIVKLCSILGISAAYMLDYYDNEKSTVNDREFDIVRKYRALDEHGKNMFEFVVSSEYERVIGGNVKLPQKDEKILNKKTRRITYYDSAASAGTGQYIDDVKKNQIKIPFNHVTENADYVIPISGNSMEPMFSDHDRVCVKYQTTVNIGEIGVFILNGEAYVKEFGGNRLISLNAKYPDIKFSEYDNIVCRGKVLGKV